MAKRKKTTRKVSAPLFAQRVPPGGAMAVEAKRGHREPADEHAATELVLFIENTSDLSPDGPRGQGHDVLLNALRKWKKGTYDSEKAVRLFEYLVESGAKRYAKEYGTEREWSTMFTPATRHEAAKQLEASFRSSVENGEYDNVDTRIGRAREVEARRSDDRPISMSYGELPPFEQFEQDIRRPDPDHKEHHPYWPEYTRFPMELVSAREIELAERYGLPEFEAERRRTGRNSRVRGFNADEREMYGFLEYLIEQMNDGDEEASDLASSIMTTLGYEWI